MAGAIAVALPAYAFARRIKTAVLRGAIHLPDRGRPITTSLVAGAAIFGVGWGLSGLCPGPAIVLLSTAQLKAFSFFAAVAIGIWAAALIPERKPKIGAETTAQAALPRKLPAEPIQQAINAEK
jgi:uncharacterized membrane protein YedE/YeeE